MNQRNRNRILHTGLAIVLGSPTIGFAGAWTQPKGTTWFKAGYMFQSTDERYFIDGSRIPYFFEGHNRTMALFFDLKQGITDRVDVEVQVPFFSIDFNDIADERQSVGIGDIRAGIRYNFILDPLVVTLGTKVKFPTGEFINDAEVVPVGEGQFDVEVTGEVARSLWPWPGYVTGLVGYRVRTKNEETGIDFGDELIWSAEGGYGITSRLWVKARIWGLYGLGSTSFGLPIPSLQREIIYLEPGMTYNLSSTGGIEVTVPITLRGKNWPAGPVLSIGFYQNF